MVTVSVLAIHLSLIVNLMLWLGARLMRWSRRTSRDRLGIIGALFTLSFWLSARNSRNLSFSLGLLLNNHWRTTDRKSLAHKYVFAEAVQVVKR